MPQGIIALCALAATIGLGHTLLGPDHYVPFVAMAKARKWSILRTAVITLLCGLGHVGSSVVLGLVGVAAGTAVAKLEGVEAVRGDVAAWLLTAFGLVYMVWGIRRAIRNRPHSHGHLHVDDDSHSHTHTHDGEHLHVHDKAGRKSLTPWVLFTVFIFGPCEPLIPMLMYPAAKQSVAGMVMVAGVFAVVTIGTMMAVVLAATFAINFVPTGRLERYTHALAGAAMLACGVAILTIGL